MPFRRAKHARDPDGESQDVPEAGKAEPKQRPADSAAGSAPGSVAGSPPGSAAGSVPGSGTGSPPGSMDVLLDAFNGAAGPSAGDRDPAAGSAGQGSADSGAAASGAAADGPDLEPQRGRVRRARLAFRRWRRTRPFWAGVWCLIGGGIIIYGPLTVIKFVLVSGTVVWAGVLVGALICVMGLFMWFSPHLRQVLGVIAAMLAIVSLVTSNFGGFLIGLLFGVLGGAMAFAWTPVPIKVDGADVPPTAGPPPAPGTGQSAATSQPNAGPAGEARPGTGEAGPGTGEAGPGTGEGAEAGPRTGQEGEAGPGTGQEGEAPRLPSARNGSAVAPAAAAHGHSSLARARE